MANEKISEYLVEQTTPQLTDRIDISTDIGGTPDTNYITWGTILTQIPTLYSSDSTLAGARQVDQDSNALSFINGMTGFGGVPTLARVQIDGLGDTDATAGLWHRNNSGANMHILYDDGSTFFSGSLSVGVNAPGTTIGVDVNGAIFQFDYRSNSTFTGADHYAFYHFTVAANAGFSNIGLFLDITGGDDNYGVLVNNGFSGFGTITPTTDVHIEGGFRYVDGNQAAGRILESDANGLATWVVGGGGGGETLAATLVIGKTTGSSNIDWSTTGVPAVSTATQLGSRRAVFINTLWDGGAEQIRNFEQYANASITVDEETFLRTDYDGVTLTYLRQDGRFGLGAEPLGKFHADGEGTGTGILALFRDSGAVQRLKLLDNGNFTLVTGGSASIDITGATVLRQSSPGVNPLEIFNNAAAIRMRLTSSGLFQFTTGGTNSFDVTAASIFRQSSPGVIPFQVNLSTAAILLATGVSGGFAIGKAYSAGVLEMNMATEDSIFVDAGSAAATQQDWIEVTVGGNTGFIHVFAAK